MKLLTHNMLTSKCMKAVTTGYPLAIQARDVKVGFAIIMIILMITLFMIILIIIILAIFVTILTDSDRR